MITNLTEYIPYFVDNQFKTEFNYLDFFFLKILPGNLPEPRTGGKYRIINFPGFSRGFPCNAVIDVKHSCYFV